MTQIAIRLNERKSASITKIMKIFTKAEAMATINSERPSEKTLDHWLGSGDAVDLVMVHKYMSPAVVRLTQEMAERCVGKTIYVWMGQFQAKVGKFTKGEKIKLLEAMKIVSCDDEVTVEMGDKDSKYQFEISEQFRDDLLRSGSGGDVIYAFLAEEKTDSLPSAMSKLEVGKQTLEEKLSQIPLSDLKKFCREKGIKGFSNKSKSELITHVLKT